ncbi:MAG: acyltransferase [Lewinella sp.]|uniref:acyltransferase n=1 Tax=Lewinella sp. TaxID=2004506 RepID=UPI003D6C174D
MVFSGRPNYISSTAWFDGTSYKLIEIGRGTTISSNVSVLTHDWALHTIGRALGIETVKPLGRIQGVKIGEFCFVGRGSTLMPGCKLGRGTVVGAGAVVRGDIPDYSIVVGNPGIVTGRSDEYYKKMVASPS